MPSEVKAFLSVFTGFVPLILLWSIPNHYALVLGTAMILILLAKSIIMKNIGILTIVLTIFFLTSSVLYFYCHLSVVLDHKALISYILLALTGFITAAIGKPYTMYDARVGYPKSFWGSPLFIEVNVLITRIWAVIYLINTVIMLLLGNSILALVLSNSIIAVGIISSIAIPKLMPGTFE
jgi:hypothetical protein